VNGGQIVEWIYNAFWLSDFLDMLISNDATAKEFARAPLFLDMRGLKVLSQQNLPDSSSLKKKSNTLTR